MQVRLPSLHDIIEDSDVVVVAKDTDVLVLMVWVYAKCNIKKKWYMKYDDDKYADIGAIVEQWGTQYHSSCQQYMH